MKKEKKINKANTDKINRGIKSVERESVDEIQKLHDRIFEEKNAGRFKKVKKFSNLIMRNL